MKQLKLRLGSKLMLAVIGLTVVQLAIANYVIRNRMRAIALSTAESTLLAEANAFALALEKGTETGDTITALAPGAPHPAVQQAMEVLLEQARIRGHSSLQAVYSNAEGKAVVTRALAGQWNATEFAELPTSPGIHHGAEWTAVVAVSPRSSGRLTTLVRTEDLLEDAKHAELLGVSFSVLMLLVGGVGAAIIGWQISKPLRELSRAVRKVARSGDLRARIAVDRGDEIGEVADAFQEMTTRLADLVRAVQVSVEQLKSASATLNSSASVQAETLTRQAAALQETQTTAQEIRQTSLLAAQKADGILVTADKGDVLGRDGESALQDSLQSLSDLHKQVGDISKQILDLSWRALQIESITTTVKDLANQSNMLALNAAIEASRSGEHGKGFAIVAREIRTLADRSIKATRQVREILDDLSTRIVQTAETTEGGARRMETGIEQIRTSGERLRELSTMMREGSSAARQIAAAVSQQSAGIGEIFAAVTEQGRMMDESLQRISSTSDAAMMVDRVAGEVSRLLSGYRT